MLDSGTDDGAGFLTSSEVESLLESVVEARGGQLLGWVLDEVDQTPERSTTAIYRAEIAWPHGTRTELLGVSARAGQLDESDTNARIFTDGERRFAVWKYPDDPDLPGLSRAAFPEQMAEVLNEGRVFSSPVVASEVSLEMIGYRPRRRAVVRMETRGETFYVKVLRQRQMAEVVERHAVLARSRFPSPSLVMTTDDHLLVTRELPGRPLSSELFAPGDPCSAEDLIETLDSLPLGVAALPRRAPWSDSAAHYGNMVSTSCASVASDVKWLVAQITEGLADIPKGNEATHGDFHEGQVHVAGGKVVGVLDIDTIGPGSRADDLACMMAHLATIHHMDKVQQARVRDLLAKWVPVFDERVDPIELRLRTAGVILSLATGPFRSQDPDWEAETRQMIAAAVGLVKQVT